MEYIFVAWIGHGCMLPRYPGSLTQLPNLEVVEELHAAIDGPVKRHLENKSRKQLAFIVRMNSLNIGDFC